MVKTEIFGPLDHELGEWNPEFGGFKACGEGSKADMVKLGKKLKKQNPTFRYEITDFKSFVVWKSD